MSKRNRFMLSIIIVIILIISSVMSLTYASNIIKLEGMFKTDGVDVTIDTEDTDKLIAPNMTVPYAPVITYKGIDAYIRFKIDISNENLTIDNFNGLSDEWVERGDYYYYTKPVKHNTELATFKNFHVPSEWDELDPLLFMNSEFTITAMCDAVQADNFKPDFENDKPWGSLEIQDNDYNGDEYKKDKSEKTTPVQISIKDSSKYTLDSNILNIKNVKPGDHYENDVIINNEGNKKIELFFSTDDLETSDKYNLLDVIKLRLSVDGKEFYNGTLRAKELNKWKSLIVMDKDTTHKIHYDVVVPAELDNNYEVKEQKFIWNLMMKTIPETPKTGDIQKLGIWVVIMVTSLYALYVLRKKANNEEK